MENKISGTLERCQKIVEELHEWAVIDPDLTELTLELDRHLEDLFVMTGSEEHVDEQLSEAGIDPDALVERAMKKIEQPLAGDTSDIFHDVLLAITEASVRSYQSGKRAGMEEK
tara:strand:- start:1148 stop:1489 length:342 start_codon:yes stop_codon:yes gene_type:complete